MGFTDILKRLEALKAFLTTAAPDALDRSALVLDQVGDALRDAAVFLRGRGSAIGTLSAEDGAAIAQLEAMEAELSGPRTMAAGWEWLVPVILEVIRLVLERRRPQPG